MYILTSIGDYTHTRQRRLVLVDKGRLWLNGVVPYVYEDNLGKISYLYLSMYLTQSNHG